jgi:hypothetical protein
MSVSDEKRTSERLAACACGALRLRVAGEPTQVYACSCLLCQRQSGSVFTYTAFYREPQISTIEGPFHSWRRGSEFGRWVESSFCPTCGSQVFGRVEALPNEIGVSVGCFSDPAFPAPSIIYWGSHKGHWLALPGIEALAEQ